MRDEEWIEEKGWVKIKTFKIPLSVMDELLSRITLIPWYNGGLDSNLEYVFSDYDCDKLIKKEEIE